MKRVVILVHEGFFTQHLSEYQNVNLKFIVKKLQEKNFTVELLEYSELGKQSYKIDDSAIYWTGSHQNLDVKKYINDILIARFSQRNNLVPRLDTVISHENKGMQGILASELDLELIEQDYHCTATYNFKYNNDKASVFKSLGGAGSIGVSLVINNRQYIQSILKNGLLNSSLLHGRELFKNLIRRILGRKEQADYLKSYSRYVTQKFVNGLKFDYKVLVFGEHVYFLKRLVRENDFRASGSGEFVFEDEIDPKLVNFALDCRSKLNVPYCSLDLIEYDNGNIGLIEFQTVHFGPYTLLESKNFYDAKNNKCNSTFTFEEELVNAFLIYFD